MYPEVYPEAGDKVRLTGDHQPHDDVGTVLRSGTLHTGEPYAIVDWPHQPHRWNTVRKKDLEVVERAPHNRR